MTEIGRRSDLELTKDTTYLGHEGGGGDCREHFGGIDHVKTGPHCISTHYIDVIMTTMTSQITSLTVVYSTVYSDADQKKTQSSASLAFVWGIHRDRWIPRTKGQLRRKCFHLMTWSWRVVWLQGCPVVCDTQPNLSQEPANRSQGSGSSLCKRRTQHCCRLAIMGNPNRSPSESMFWSTRALNELIVTVMYAECFTQVCP